jgi:hypothetical protein
MTDDTAIDGSLDVPVDCAYAMGPSYSEKSRPGKAVNLALRNSGWIYRRRPRRPPRTA